MRFRSVLGTLIDFLRIDSDWFFVFFVKICYYISITPNVFASSFAAVEVHLFHFIKNEASASELLEEGSPVFKNISL